MRVEVDRELCESNALCMGAAPEVFEVREDDLLYVLMDEPPEELRSKVRQAAASRTIRTDLSGSYLTAKPARLIVSQLGQLPKLVINARLKAGG